MIISHQGLATIAERFLEVLKEENISSLEIALSLSGRKIKFRESLPDYLHIFESQSNQGTTALKLAYICPNFEGVPLEAAINSRLNYQQIVAKCMGPIPGYSPFSIDPYGNLVYFKKSQGANWDELVREINFLSRLGAR